MSKRPLEDVVYSGLKLVWLVLQVVLILLKLIGVLHVSWLWILLPISNMMIWIRNHLYICKIILC